MFVKNIEGCDKVDTRSSSPNRHWMIVFFGRVSSIYGQPGLDRYALGGPTDSYHLENGKVTLEGCCNAGC